MRSDISAQTFNSAPPPWIEWSYGLVTDWPTGSTIPALFAQRAAAAPHAVAVIDGATRWTYAELDRHSDRVAARLIATGLPPGGLIGIRGVRSAGFVAEALGILKAGGAYVPLDLEEPPERQARRRADCTVLLDNVPDCAAPSAPVKSRATAESAAYLLYTSGSTGTPKGVLVPHRAIVRLVCATDYLDVRPDDVFAFHSHLSFDASTLELWAPLLHGASLVVTTTESVLSAGALAAHLRQHGVTTLWLTTSLFNQLVADAPSMFAGLRHLIFGGEAADAPTIRRILAAGPPARLTNGYGPTECTTFAVCHRIERAEDRIPIGRPIANTQAIILDEKLQPAEEGELHIGGAGLAIGYLHAPELTAERFIETPFGRLYKTGDRARWRADGTIDYLGRLDRQMKLRGFRIEPAEIEAAIREFQGIRQCVAAVKQSESGREMLTAYLVGTAEPGALRHFLRGKLPAQMIPQAFVTMDVLPLTPNGKLDHRALPPPRGDHPELRPGFIAPQDDGQSRLAAIWQRVLGLNAVGIDDPFFDLGGTSLLLARAHSLVAAEFARPDLPIVALFQHPTIRALARHLDSAPKPTAASPASAHARAARLRQAMAQRRLPSTE